MAEAFHRPVMLQKCLEGLAIRPGGTYVDVTFGGGGHTRGILERLEGGQVFAFDQDPDAAANVAAIADGRLQLIEANFRYLRRYLRLHGVVEIDGLLADLGISSHQIDAPERGFSTRQEGELDMRMDQKAPKSAREVVNTYPEQELHRLLGQFGEVRNARTLAAAMVAARINGSIDTTTDLTSVLKKYAPRGKENKYYAQVFQALRIEVNDEMAALEELLQQAAILLKPGGRLVVLSYHSLEDRMVKNFIQKGKMAGEVEKDIYGNEIKPLQAVNRKPIAPSAEEIADNPRARSAKLRVAEKKKETKK